MIRRAIDFEYNIYHYSDINVPLTLTDLQEIKGLSLSLNNNDMTGKETAVLLKLKLDSATYATMVIREITKNPTSQIYQRELQKIYDEKIGKLNEEEENLIEEVVEIVKD